VKTGATDDLHVTGFGSLADPIDPSKGVAEGARAVRWHLDAALGSPAAPPPRVDDDVHHRDGGGADDHSQDLVNKIGGDLPELFARPVLNGVRRPYDACVETQCP
jgi:hypothetical protein